MNDAYVSTIDSFCLNVLKKFYYLVEEEIDNQIKYLSPNFSILANSKGLLSETIGNVLEELVQEDSTSTDLLFTVFGSKQNISSFIIDVYYKLLNIPNFQIYLENDFEKLNSLIIDNVDIDYAVIYEFSKFDNLTTKEAITTAFNFSLHIKKYLENNKKEADLDIISLVNLDNDKKEKIIKYLQQDEISLKSNQEELEEIIEIIEKLDNQLKIENNIFDTALLTKIYDELIDYLNYFKTIEKISGLSRTIKKVLKKLHNDFIKRKRENNFLDFPD